MIGYFFPNFLIPVKIDLILIRNYYELVEALVMLVTQVTIDLIHIGITTN